MIHGSVRTDNYITVDGCRIRYRRTGSGRPILLVHGTTSSLEHFDRLTALFEPNWEVIRLDLPGFGLTGPQPDRDYRISTYTKTVARFMDELGVGRFAALGNSLGGNIAWNLALDLPSRVDALVLVNATGYPIKALPKGMQLARKPWIRPVLRRFLPRGMVEKNLRQAVGRTSTIVDDDMVSRVHRLWSQPGNKSAFVDFVNTNQLDRSGRLGEIRCPTLILTSGSMPQLFATDIPGAVEKVYADGGHLLPEEQPQWVGEAVAHFFNTTTDRDTI